MCSYDPPPHYLCKRVDDVNSSWEQLSAVSLSEVETGQAVSEQTTVKACWDDSALYIRFQCVDSYIVSNFKNRNDPLYEQDVVEVFIDEAGTGKHYIELELSPHNVVFEAHITRMHSGSTREITLKLNEDEQWLSTQVEVKEQLRIYTLTIPFRIFEQPPVIGVEWRINLYRIDESRAGVREYQAWSPTGRIDYHIPERFGSFRFID